MLPAIRKLKPAQALCETGAARGPKAAHRSCNCNLHLLTTQYLKLTCHGSRQHESTKEEKNQNLGRNHKPKVALSLTHATTSRALLHSCSRATRYATTYKQGSAKHAREAKPSHNTMQRHSTMREALIPLITQSLADPSHWPLGHPVCQASAGAPLSPLSHTNSFSKEAIEHAGCKNPTEGSVDGAFAQAFRTPLSV